MKNYCRKKGGRQSVPLFCHPMHPKFVREICHELCASWAVFGTPESGVGLQGALASKVAVVALARNQKHKEILQTEILESLQEKIVASNTDFSMNSLVKGIAEPNSKRHAQKL